MAMWVKSLFFSETGAYFFYLTPDLESAHFFDLEKLCLRFVISRLGYSIQIVNVGSNWANTEASPFLSTRILTLLEEKNMQNIYFEPFAISSKNFNGLPFLHQKMSRIPHKK